jgi:hypothetical protein
VLEILKNLINDLKIGFEDESQIFDETEGEPMTVDEMN